MKQILLCTDGSAFAQSSYRYAAWLAAGLDACIEVLYVTDVRSQKAVAMRNYSGSIGIDASRTLLNKLVDLEHEKAKINHQRAKLILEEAEDCLSAAGAHSVRLIHETGFLVDSLHEFEAHADLIILGKRGETAEFASGHLGANVERIIRASHKPCLVTPRQFKPVERLLVAYDGSQSCQKMLQFLVASPVFKGLELHLLTVATHTADEAAAHLNEAEQKARAAGFAPVSQLLPGNPETEIARYIEAQAIDLLLMGAYGHSRIRHLVVGSTTVQMLRSSSIPVMLFR